ncbi:hypothetical protein [Nocardia brevicatena]|nr:hypothetical protein [Nocardia brevicatena]
MRTSTTSQEIRRHDSRRIVPNFGTPRSADVLILLWVVLMAALSAAMVLI